mmetsp:Transcript_66935/g.160295  ORF Transcript_66935/g.160295 Transcript_66935/m.160295 type:complete len:147 (+) Transcript_66935:63-503(+)
MAGLGRCTSRQPYRPAARLPLLGLALFLACRALMCARPDSTFVGSSRLSLAQPSQTPTQAKPSTSEEVESKQRQKSEDPSEYGAAYYAGMITSPLKAEDQEKDLMTPTLKFAGFGTAAIVLLLGVFLLSNGWLAQGDPKSTPLPGF